MNVALEWYGIDGTATKLPGEYDSNYRIRTTLGEQYLLRVSHESETREFVEFQNAMLARLAESRASRLLQKLVRNRRGETVSIVDGRMVRLFTWIEGRTMAETQPQPEDLLESWGEALALTDEGLQGFQSAAARRDLKWDLSRAEWILKDLDLIQDRNRRALIEMYCARYPKLDGLRRAVIHNDANDHNVLVRDQQVVGLIDFGDALEGPLVCNLAIAMAYAMCGKQEPQRAAAHVMKGYRKIFPLTDDEQALLFPLATMRLCVSVVNSARRKKEVPDDQYAVISEAPAWETLERLDSLLEKRRRLVGYNLSLSYKEPLEIVRGEGQYLYSASGRRYLDAYNNVPHVGHCHPHVVEAAARQMATLNTNTRYLHEGIVRYAERLTEKLPGNLKVVYLTASGSEATELALRLARTHTGRKDLIVSDGAYHGHTTTLIDISPYKAEGPGGRGLPDWAHKTAVPDEYRGYAADIDEIMAPVKGLCGFIIESIPSVAGQIVLPDGYLPDVYAKVRAKGGLCIADEVQTGFGRIGTHFWAFERYGVRPDIVAMGKPIGNGYPMGAVVTTPEIARSFDNGMEFFSTFGGSTVACAVGNAVLDVLEREKLQQNALNVGNYLLTRLTSLASKHDLIGDVRGSGLMLGIELVKDRKTKAPAAKEASHLVEQMKESGVLLGTDGIHHNVIKLRGPMCMTRVDAETMIQALAATLCNS